MTIITLYIPVRDVGEDADLLVFDLIAHLADSCTDSRIDLQEITYEIKES